MDTLLQDLRYALRSMRRAPVLAATTVLTLALGIGLNASMFTILGGLLFRARVETDPKSFVHLSPEYKETAGSTGIAWAVSVRDYHAYRTGARTLGDLAAWSTVHLTVGNADSESVLALLTTCNFFRVYGLDRPMQGRLFNGAECSTPGSAPVALLSEEIWRGRFGADPQMIGKTILFNRVPFTVIGIIPEGFSGRLRGPGIWIPYSMQSLFFQGRDLFRDPARWLTVEGRLRPGYSRSDAQAELAVIAAQQDRLEPGRQTSLLLTNGSMAEEPSMRSRVYWIGPLIMGALTLLLLIACTNVTVLQLSRAVTRRREMGIRLSMGAGRGRLIRMLLTESLLLAAVAGAIGGLIAREAPLVFAKTLASPATPFYQLKPDLWTLAYIGCIVLAVACIAGLAPAGESLRVDLATSMKGGSSSGTLSVRNWRRDLLVTSQVAMSFVLLVGAGLFIRVQEAFLSSDPGFEARQVLAVSAPGKFVERLAERVRAIPGVQVVAFGSPLAQGEFGSDRVELRAPGQEKGTGKLAGVSTVSAEYFNVLNIPITRGRPFTKAEEGGSTAVAMVSQALARSFWPGQNPLGQRVVLPDGAALEVVGVARDIQAERIGEVDGPHLYRLRDPHSTADAMLVRFAGDERPIQALVQSAAKDLDPEARDTPRTLRGMIDDALGSLSTLVNVVSALAGLAALLAVIGIYGVVAFAVSQRTKEFGIRMALGATRSLVVKLVLRSGARPVVAGLGVGLIVAIFGARVLTRVLQHTPVALHPGDPVPYLAMAALLGLAAVLAMFRPAVRAARADPMQALRDE